MQALYGIGFLLACIYHVCHMDEAGLIASRVMGLSGAFWRSADVYMAQWLLGRMWGHALQASHPVTAGMLLSLPASICKLCNTACALYGVVAQVRLLGHLVGASYPAGMVQTHCSP